MRDRLMSCIRDAVEEVNESREEKILPESLDTIFLYGEKGIFDSMQLVNFLMIVEEKIAADLDYEITIASERAVSRKISPFRNIPHLIDFILEEIEILKAA